MGDHGGAQRLGQRRQLEDGVGVDLIAGSSPLRTSLTPKPLAYTVFPPCTTATAIPGMPGLLISSSAMPSSLPRRSRQRSRAAASRAPAAAGHRRRWARLKVRPARVGRVRQPATSSRAATAVLASALMTCTVTVARRNRRFAGRSPHFSCDSYVSASRRRPIRLQLPPRVDRGCGGWIDTLAGPGRRNLHARGLRRRPSAARWVPTTDAAPAGTSPNGSAPAARAGVGDVEVGANRVLGVHVDVGPGRVVGPDRHQREIERPVIRADFGEALGVTRVAAEEGAVPRPGDHP